MKPSESAMEMECLWEKRILNLLDKSECRKLLYTNHKQSPNVYFFLGLMGPINDCGQSP